MVHCILKTALFESPAEQVNLNSELVHDSWALVIEASYFCEYKSHKLKLNLTLGSNTKPLDVHERLSIDLMAPEVGLRWHEQPVVALLDLLAPVIHMPRKEGAISQSPLYPYSSGQ